MDLPTRTDYAAIGRAYLTQRATKLDPRQVDVLGSNANIYVGVAAVLCQAVTDQIAQKVSTLLLDAIVDMDDAARYALDRYKLTPKGAGAAVGTVRFYRATNANGPGAVPVGTRLKTPAGIEYITTSQATFSATGPSSLQASAFVRALQAGKASQVGKNNIRSFSVPTSVFDQTIQVTNDGATSGGEDAEDLDAFKARIRGFWVAARRGVLGAISFGALTVPGVASAVAYEVTDPDGAAARVVRLYIADSSGVSNTALANAVAPALLDFRAAGINVEIVTSIPLLVSVAVAAQFSAGTDTVTLAENIRAAVVEFVNSLPVNGTLAAIDLASVLRRFADSGLVPQGSGITSPAGDLVPAVGQTLRTTPSLVTVNGL